MKEGVSSGLYQPTEPAWLKSLVDKLASSKVCPPMDCTAKTEG